MYFHVLCMFTGKTKCSCKSKLNQNMSKPATAAGTDSIQCLLFFLTLFTLSCWVVWMCKHYLLAKNQHNSPAFSTSSGGHSQTQTNVLSRISSNSCREEPSETQSSAAVLVMVHCLPSVSDRSEAVWFNLQSESAPQGPEPRSLWCKFTQSIPLLTHGSCAANNRLPVWHLRLLDRGISFGDVSVEKERQRWGSSRTSFLMNRWGMDVVWEKIYNL